MTEQATTPTAPEVSVEEPSPLTLEMRALLAVNTDHVSGVPVRVTVSVDYNPRSQRFQVAFASKPSEEVRDVLKLMNFGWNKFEAAWELYTWQARLYDRSQLALFLSALNRGVITDIPLVPDKAKRLWWKDVRDSQKRHVEQLAEAVQAERSSQGFGQWLRLVKSFHHYSRNNMFSIRMQCPGASWVAGERKWNEKGRFVKWGEEPLVILGPRIRNIYEKDPQTGERVKVGQRVAGFLALPVYDISQTEGAPLDTGMPDLEGDDAEPFLSAIICFCEEHGLEVDFTELREMLKGLSLGGKVLIDSRRSINEKFAVLVHEIAHEYLHKERIDIPVKTREIEAEGVAYIVCEYFGLPNQSPQYITRKGADAREVMECMESISQAGRVIVNYLVERVCD